MPAGSTDVFLPGRATRGTSKRNWYLIGGAVAVGILAYFVYKRAKSGGSTADTSQPAADQTGAGGGSGGDTTGSSTYPDYPAYPAYPVFPVGSPVGQDLNPQQPSPIELSIPDFSQFPTPVFQIIMPDQSTVGDGTTGDGAHTQPEIPGATAATTGFRTIEDQPGAITKTPTGATVNVKIRASAPAATGPKPGTATVKLVKVPSAPGLPNVSQKYPAPIASKLTHPVSAPPSATGAGSKAPTPKPSRVSLGSARNGTVTMIPHGRGLGGPQA